MDRPLRIGGVAAALVIALVVIAASSRPVQLWGVSSSGSAPVPVAEPTDNTEPATEEPPQQREDKQFPPWVADIVQFVMVTVSFTAAIVLIVWVSRRRLRGRNPLRWARGRRGAFPEPLPEFDEPTPSLATVDFGAAHLALAVGDPSEAIIACWLRLEHDAAAAGVERHPHETSAEYAERVVAEASVDPQPIRELAALYREARFSRHRLSDDHRQRARNALARVESALRHRPSTVGAIT